MSRIAYINGRYVPQSRAQVAVEDRGYLFSDGVYDVIPVHNGHLSFADRHLDRLDRSLAELRIARPMSRAALLQVAREVLRRNGIRNGGLYIQVTRGVAPRDHKFPKGVAPSLLIMAKRLKAPAPDLLAKGVAVVTMPDQRWARRDIKSISLVANVLAKQAAVEQGAFEAWLVDHDDMVTEGSSTSASSMAAILIHVMRSPSQSQASTPATRGAALCRNRMVATDVCCSAMMKLVDAVPKQIPTASPPHPRFRNNASMFRPSRTAR